MKSTGVLLVVIALIALPLVGQQPAAKRHPGDSIHYQITVDGGDIGKIDHIAIDFNSPSPEPPNQPGITNGFSGNCTKAAPAPNVWNCIATIPNGIWNGDYRLAQVNVTAGIFTKTYIQDFNVPLIPIENPQTFTPPTKVSVKEQP